MELNLTKIQIDEIIKRIEKAEIILVDLSRIGDVNLDSVTVTSEYFANMLED